MAFTDHDLFIPHPELVDDGFLPLAGFEIGLEAAGEWDLVPGCFLNFIALSDDITLHPLWHREKYLFGNAPEYRHLVQFDPAQPDFEREYSAACVNEVIRIGREKGFFVSYNHPGWCMEAPGRYLAYKNLSAVEIYTHGTAVAGFPDGEGVYDALLLAGERPLALAADDNHNRAAFGSTSCDSFGGYVMLAADSLTYPAVSDSLARGRYYSSTGAEILSLTFADGILSVRTSPARSITMTAAVRRGVKVVRAEADKAVTSAQFSVEPCFSFVRITVTGDNGCAWTNAYDTSYLFSGQDQ